MEDFNYGEQKRLQILKSFGEDNNDIEKGKSGEGSRGGKVIGHTRTGKAIYEDGKHSDYDNFHEQDHSEAAHQHSQLAERARVKKNSHETLRAMAEEDKDREAIKMHASKVKEHDEEELHHSSQSIYHQEQAKPQEVRDRHSEVGKRVDKIFKEKDLKSLEKEYNDKNVDELVSLKKKLYPNPDVESAMKPEEKLLNKVIADKYSDINEQIRLKRSKK